MLSPPPSPGVTSQLCHSNLSRPNSALGRGGIRNPVSRGVALANQRLRPLGHRGSATRFFNCLLFIAGFWALIRPWRPFRDIIRQTVLVDTGTSGDQVSWSSAAVRKGLALDFRANKRSSRAVVLRGLPDLGLSKTSPVSSYIFLILCT